MQKLTAAVLRHRIVVVVVWIALTVVGALFVGKANSGLSHQQASPGLAGYDANQAMIRHLGLDGGEAPAIAVLHLPAAALIVLAFVYGSAIAVVPLLMALPSILVSFLMLYGLEQLTPISSLLQYLVALIGLGSRSTTRC